MNRMALPPSATIGIIGGGQLGRMSAMAAARLGYRCHILTPEPDGPAAQVAAATTVGAYEDQDSLARFADAVDVITFAQTGLYTHAIPQQPKAGGTADCSTRLARIRFGRPLSICRGRGGIPIPNS